jgi:histidine ammonia-lyase
MLGCVARASTPVMVRNRISSLIRVSRRTISLSHTELFGSAQQFTSGRVHCKQQSRKFEHASTIREVLVLSPVLVTGRNHRFGYRNGVLAM